MPTQKVVSTPYKLIDSDPHASRVISYMRPSDLAVWGGATAAAPGALYLWGEYLEITRNSDPKTDNVFLRYQSSLSPRSPPSGFLCASLEFLALLGDSYSPTRGQVVRSFRPKSCRTCVSNYSSPLVRFWGWTENERESAMDLTELRARAQQGLPLYGQSDQPEWVQQAAHSNSAFSQLKFCEFTHSARLNMYLFLCLQRPSQCLFSFNNPRISC